MSIHIIELRAELVKVESNIARHQKEAASENFEIANGSKSFLKQYERDAAILRLAIKALEAGL